MHDDVERGPVRVRTIEAKSCQSDVDQTGVRGQQRPGRESELIHRAGPQVLDDDVGVAGESPKDLAALRVLQIYREAALVPIEPSEVPTFAVRERLEESGEVAASRALDFHDVRAKIGELHAAEGTRHVIADLDDPDPRQWRGVRGGLSPRCS